MGKWTRRAFISAGVVAGGVVVFGVAATVCFYLQSVVEERYCRSRFGAPYDSYLRQVPRFNVILGLWRKATRAGKVDS